MASPKFKPAYGQDGLEWAPKDSEFRDMARVAWDTHKHPRRVTTAFKAAFDFASCFNCFAEALWRCRYCEMIFCHQEPCKVIHEAAHTIMLLAGDDE